MTEFSFEKLPEFDHHKLVTFLSDESSGLRAFVAIHNDTIGPAIGGTRMWPYQSEVEAVRDALNLSKAMTYKCAVAGVRFGGGKGVIIGDPENGKKAATLQDYARLTKDYFGQKFRTGTDVGITDEEVKMMSKENPYLVGVMNDDKLSTGKMAALGVFYGIQGALEEETGSSAINGKSFAIKGLGKTGMELARLLLEGGGKVIAADVDKIKVGYAEKHYQEIKIVSAETIHSEKVDVYSPCALGCEFDEKRIEELQCSIIAGAANNQLALSEIGDELWKKGIIYVPDYVINSGGLINVADELEPDGYHKDRVLARVRAIKQTVERIIERAKKQNQSTHRIADQMAEEIFRGK